MSGRITILRGWNLASGNASSTRERGLKSFVVKILYAHYRMFYKSFALATGDSAGKSSARAAGTSLGVSHLRLLPGFFRRARKTQRAPVKTLPRRRDNALSQYCHLASAVIHSRKYLPSTRGKSCQKKEPRAQIFYKVFQLPHVRRIDRAWVRALARAHERRKKRVFVYQNINFSTNFNS